MCTLLIQNSYRICLDIPQIWHTSLNNTFFFVESRFKRSRRPVPLISSQFQRHFFRFFKPRSFLVLYSLTFLCFDFWLSHAYAESADATDADIRQHGPALRNKLRTEISWSLFWSVSLLFEAGLVWSFWFFFWFSTVIRILSILRFLVFQKDLFDLQNLSDLKQKLTVWCIQIHVSTSYNDSCVLTNFSELLCIWDCQQKSISVFGSPE